MPHALALDYEQAWKLAATHKYPVWDALIIAIWAKHGVKINGGQIPIKFAVISDHRANAVPSNTMMHNAQCTTRKSITNLRGCHAKANDHYPG
jgi:hypothetical protein